jgi:hypothetical protein
MSYTAGNLHKRPGALQISSAMAHIAANLAQIDGYSHAASSMAHTVGT